MEFENSVSQLQLLKKMEKQIVKDEGIKLLPNYERAYQAY